MIGFLILIWFKKMKTIKLTFLVNEAVSNFQLINTNKQFTNKYTKLIENDTHN